VIIVAVETSDTWQLALWSCTLVV